MRSIEEQRNIEIRPGFSPKPQTIAAPEMGDSPSIEPDTPSPAGLADGRLIQKAILKPEAGAEITVKDGIVDFGK